MKGRNHIKIAHWSSLGEGTKGRREEGASLEDYFLELPTLRAKCHSVRALHTVGILQLEECQDDAGW